MESSIHSGRGKPPWPTGIAAVGGRSAIGRADDDGTARCADDVSRDAAEEHRARRPVAARADDEQVQLAALLGESLACVSFEQERLRVDALQAGDGRGEPVVERGAQGLPTTMRSLVLTSACGRCAAA
jgi:hypothetical protein